MADWEEWQKFGFRHFRSVGDVETATPSRGVVRQLPVSSFSGDDVAGLEGPQMMGME